MYREDPFRDRRHRKERPVNLDSNDRSWLEGRFNSINEQMQAGFNTIHERIARHKEALDVRANQVDLEVATLRERMAVEETRPCSAVIRHVDECHKGWSARVLAIIASVIAMGEAFFLLAKEIFK
jgi:hypothetical protein